MKTFLGLALGAALVVSPLVPAQAADNNAAILLPSVYAYYSTSTPNVPPGSPFSGLDVWASQLAPVQVAGNSPYVYNSIVMTIQARNLTSDGLNGRVQTAKIDLFECNTATIDPTQCSLRNTQTSYVANPAASTTWQKVASWDASKLTFGKYYFPKVTLTFTNKEVLFSGNEFAVKRYAFVPGGIRSTAPSLNNLGTVAGTINAGKSGTEVSFGKWENVIDAFALRRTLHYLTCDQPQNGLGIIDARAALPAGCTSFKLIDVMQSGQGSILSSMTSASFTTPTTAGKYLVTMDTLEITNPNYPACNGTGGCTFVFLQKRSSHLLVDAANPVDPNNPMIPSTPTANTGGVQGGVAPAQPTQLTQEALATATVDLVTAPLAGNDGSGSLGDTTMKLTVPKKLKRGAKKGTFLSKLVQPVSVQGKVTFAVTTGNADADVIRVKSQSLTKSKAKVRWKFSKKIAKGSYVLYASFVPTAGSTGTAMTVSKAFRLT